jgi:hypothetical protein
MNLSTELLKVAKDLLANGSISRKGFFPNRNLFKPRREDFIPRGSGVKKLTPRDTTLEIYVWEEGDKYLGMGFSSKRQKPDFNYLFRDSRRRDLFIENYINSYKEGLANKEKKRLERKEVKNVFKVGDILYSSWGYDQTNVDFYEVVESLEKSVKLRKLQSKTVNVSMGSDSVSAKPGRYADNKVLLRRVSPSGSVKIDSVSRAYKWDGRPKYETSSGWGH